MFVIRRILLAFIFFCLTYHLTALARPTPPSPSENDLFTRAHFALKFGTISNSVEPVTELYEYCQTTNQNQEFKDFIETYARPPKYRGDSHISQNMMFHCLAFDSHIANVYREKRSYAVAVIWYEFALKGFFLGDSYDAALSGYEESLRAVGRTAEADIVLARRQKREALIAAYKQAYEDWYLLNKQGQLISQIPASYVETASEEMLKFTRNGKYGFCNTTGHIVIEPSFNQVGQFSEGLAWFRKEFLRQSSKSTPEEQKVGFINKTGTVVIKPNYQMADDFSNGMARIAVFNNSKINNGYINRKGKLVIPAIYRTARPFAEGIALTSKSDQPSSWEYINQRQTVIKTIKHCQSNSMSEGLLYIQDDQQNGFMDSKGRLIINQKFLFPKNFSEGLAAVGVKDKTQIKMGFINKTSKFVLQPELDGCHSFSEGLASVKKDNKWYFVTTNGQKAFEGEFDDASQFHEGLCWVRIKDQSFFIDKNGKTVFNIQPEFTDSDHRFSGGVLVVWKKNNVSIPHSDFFDIHYTSTASKKSSWNHRHDL
ncbi:MAG: WG repeat-containing protein [Candidatus Obscuribacterales bacterium]|nr:WG repeat-containing protein [Candidatus Obscuribacterales bacterium]